MLLLAAFRDIVTQINLRDIAPGRRCHLAVI